MKNPLTNKSTRLVSSVGRYEQIQSKQKQENVCITSVDINSRGMESKHARPHLACFIEPPKGVVGVVSILKR